MAESGGTPRDYGLRVQSHPVLMVTSRLKMRSARNLALSFSGNVLETVALWRDAPTLRANLDATTVLLRSLGTPHETDPVRHRGTATGKWTGYLWNNVPFVLVDDFLCAYRTHPAAHRVNGAMLAEFIRSMNDVGELTSWTVALLGGGDGGTEDFGGLAPVERIQRKAADPGSDRYSIGRLLSPRDEAIDLDEKAWDAALEETRRMHRADAARRQAREEPDQPSGVAVRKVRGFGTQEVEPHPERGLLLLYALDPDYAELAAGTPSVIAFGISFPGSNAGRKVMYKVNNVLWEQEYGPAD